MTQAEAWEAFVAELEPHVSPEWARNARSHGGQPWIRLIAMVDVHHQMTSPQIVEKIGSTLADLAGDRAADVAGWNAIRDAAREKRRALVGRIVEVAPELLPEELVGLFERSLTPVFTE